MGIISYIGGTAELRPFSYHLKNAKIF